MDTVEKKDSNNINRKTFLKKSALSGLALGGVLSSCSNPKESTAQDTESSNFDKRYKWKMVTTWPPNFPVVGEGCNLFAKWVSEMSAGRLEIKVYGSGELVPGLETFDAVSGGAVEVGHGVAYYWSGRHPMTPFFAAVPFGMNAQQINAWLYAGGGMELYRKLYDRFNLVPFPCGNTGVQMGGWFNKEINSLEDFKGLKMRMPGLGGKVLQKVGGTAVLSSGSEIYTNLERGVIDATEWIGPYHDYLMGFHKIAKYYYYPGWHEPGPVLEMIINKRAFNQLPKDLQQIVETATYRFNLWCMSEFDAKNNLYLNKILEESDVELRKFPDEVMAKLKSASEEVVSALANEDELSKEIYDSFMSFKKNVRQWSAISEKIFHNEF